MNAPDVNPLLQAREALESECKEAFVAAAALLSERQLPASEALRHRLGAWEWNQVVSGVDAWEAE